MTSAGGSGLRTNHAFWELLTRAADCSTKPVVLGHLFQAGSCHQRNPPLGASALRVPKLLSAKCLVTKLIFFMKNKGMLPLMDLTPNHLKKKGDLG